MLGMPSDPIMVLGWRMTVCTSSSDIGCMTMVASGSRRARDQLPWLRAATTLCESPRWTGLPSRGGDRVDAMTTSEGAMRPTPPRSAGLAAEAVVLNDGCQDGAAGRVGILVGMHVEARDQAASISPRDSRTFPSSPCLRPCDARSARGRPRARRSRSLLRPTPAAVLPRLACGLRRGRQFPPSRWRVR